VVCLTHGALGSWTTPRGPLPPDRCATHDTKSATH
jgi:hypothetical protein